MNRIFTVLACVALVNVAGLGALAAYAYSHGWLQREQVREAISVLRGEPTTAAPTSMPAATMPAEEMAGRPHPDEESSKVAALELDRRRQEVRDGWRLLEVQQLALVREKESLDEEKQRKQAEMSARLQHTGETALQKEIDILSGLKPKQARELLKQKQDADVLRILLAMEDRSVRRIVGECKTSEDRRWIGRILGKLHDRDAHQAEVLDAPQ